MLLQKVTEIPFRNMLLQRQLVFIRRIQFLNNNIKRIKRIVNYFI